MNHEQEPAFSCLQGIHFKYKDTACLKEKDGEKTHNANSNYKGTKEIISITDSEDYRLKKNNQN